LEKLLREKQTVAVSGIRAGATWNDPRRALRRISRRRVISLKPFRMIVHFTLKHPISVRHNRQDFRRSAWRDAMLERSGRIAQKLTWFAESDPHATMDGTSYVLIETSIDTTERKKLVRLREWYRD